MRNRLRFKHLAEWHGYYGAKPQPPEKIEAYARELGVVYPARYVDMASKYGGMISTGEDFFVYQESDDWLWQVSNFGFLCHLDEDAKSMIYVPSLYNYEIRDLMGEEHIVPISSTEISTLVCFDFRKDRTEPSVVVCEPSARLQDPPEDAIFFIAPSFDDFLDMLMPEEKADRIADEKDAKIWARMAEKG